MQPDVQRREELRQAADRIEVSLDGRQLDQLLGHLDLLVKWNKAYNLTAIRAPAEMLRHHLLDSLAIVPALRRVGDGTPRTILDVGSGAGFPGLVVAVAMPTASVKCIDSVGKKVIFIRQVIAELVIDNASADHARIETLPMADADVVTSRAFASLLDFTRLTRHHLSRRGVWLAMKGKIPHDEIEALPDDVEVFHVEQLHISGVDNERCLIWMRPVR